MNLIIDTNIFHKFFDPTHLSHKNYRSVYKCLIECKGKMFIGGSKFEKELFNGLKKYRGILLELRRKGKLVTLPKDEVDNEVIRLKHLEAKRDFDDPHLIACIILGSIKIICTDDSRADKYIKDSKFYPKSFKVPSIYRNFNHSHLVTACCK